MGVELHIIQCESQYMNTDNCVLLGTLPLTWITGRKTGLFPNIMASRVVFSVLLYHFPPTERSCCVFTETVVAGEFVELIFDCAPQNWSSFCEGSLTFSDAHEPLFFSFLFVFFIFLHLFRAALKQYCIDKG